MKHIPIMNRGTSTSRRRLLVNEDDDDDDDEDYDRVDNFSHIKSENTAAATGGGRGFNDDDGEGTECIIDSRNLRISMNADTTNTVGNSSSDTEYHPPMCGQVFISKVIGQGSSSVGGGSSSSSNKNKQQQTKTKELKPRRSYDRRSSVIRLGNKNRGIFNQQATKLKKRTKMMMMGSGSGCTGSGGGNGGAAAAAGGYHESFSAEQSPDSDSETSSIQSCNDRIRILTTTTKIATVSVMSDDVNDHYHQHHHPITSSSNRSCGGDSGTTSSLQSPSHIVQFDPNELELIKTEKIIFDTNNTTNEQVEVDKTNISKAKSSTPSNKITISIPSSGTRKSNKNKGKLSNSISNALLSFPFSSLRSNATTTTTSLLPTVAEEKSFDLIESPSTSTTKSEPVVLNPSKDAQVSQMQDIATLLPTTSSTSSSGDEDEGDASTFFGCSTNPIHVQNINRQVDSVDDEDDEEEEDDHDEIRDDRETTTLSQFGCFTPTMNRQERNVFSSDSETSPDYVQSNNRQRQSIKRNVDRSDASITKEVVAAEASSPEMMEILKAMRQIILKQQDAIQAISHENVEFRNQLAMCHQEMKTIQSESADQLIQITQLVIQKNSMDVETTQLKDEVAVLRDEILRLKSDDADLVNRFESLMNNNGDTTDDDTTVEKSDTIRTIQFHNNINNNSTPSYNQRVSPLNDTIDQIADNELWRRMLNLNDDNRNNAADAVGITEEIEPTTFQKHGTNDITFTKPSITEETCDSMTVDVVSLSNSANLSIETAPSLVITPVTVEPLKTSIATTTEKFTPERQIITKDNHVNEFKNRLGEIQKKRMIRMGRNNSNNNDTTAATPQVKDRKIFTVRFL